MNAALCIAGDSECATGWPRRYAVAMVTRSFVAVFDAVGLLLLERHRECVPTGAVVLRDEIEVRHVRGLRGPLERRDARICDRRRRQARVEIRVVGRGQLEIVERELAPLAERVLD